MGDRGHSPGASRHRHNLISATAEQVGKDDLAQGIETFSQRAIGHSGAAWTVVDVQTEGGLRLYRATAESDSILAKDGQPDHRIPAHLA